MADKQYQIVTVAQRPELRQEVLRVGGEGWPEFMSKSAVVNEFWWQLYEQHPDCQYALIDRASEQVVAIGNSVPVCWPDDPNTLPGEGVEWALTSRFDPSEKPGSPNLLCALQIVITNDLKGQHKSGEMVLAMRQICEQQKLKHLVAPVRPNWKHRYPLMDIERYIQWITKDSLPYDPWMRVHVRLGASVMNTCPASLCIESAITKWEEWTGMHFPESGAYIVPGALVPVEFDVDSDRGRYVEPNIWMLHR